MKPSGSRCPQPLVRVLSSCSTAVQRWGAGTWCNGTGSAPFFSFTTSYGPFLEQNEKNLKMDILILMIGRKLKWDRAELRAAVAEVPVSLRTTFHSMVRAIVLKSALHDMMKNEGGTVCPSTTSH